MDNKLYVYDCPKIYDPPNKKNKSESLIGVGLIVPSNLILKKI